MPKLNHPALKPLIAKVMHEKVGIVIPVYNPIANVNLAQTQWCIKQCSDLPYQLSLGVGPQCVAANRIKGEARLNDDIRFVIHMDDDVLLPPHFMSQLLSVLVSQDNVGAVSAVMSGARGNPQNDVSPAVIPVGKVQEIEFLPGTCFAYDREKTPIVWDAEYQGSQWEDTDAMMQVKAQGYRTVATGNVQIIHRNNLNKAVKFWKENKAHFQTKWPAVLRREPLA
jgi:hypothetical protein